MNNQRVLGVDYGNKNVGLALANLETRMASPYQTIRNKGFDDLSRILKEIILEWGIKIVVFGLPLNMQEDQEVNPIYLELKEFVDKFKKTVDVEIDFVDERLSTFEAKEIIPSLSLKKKKVKEFKDSLSAQIILNKWLNKNK